MSTDEIPAPGPPPAADISIEGLPPVEIPPSMLAASAERQQASAGRLRRLIIEVVGGAVIVTAGAVATLLTRSTNALAITIFAVLVIVAYEILVTVLE